MEITYSTHARRQLRKLPRDIQEEILSAVDSLEEWPHVRNVKSLTNRTDYRLKVGRYRVVFEVIVDTIYVTQVLIRNENTY